MNESKKVSRIFSLSIKIIFNFNDIVLIFHVKKEFYDRIISTHWITLVLIIC